MELSNKLKSLSFYFKPRRVVAMYKLYFGDEWLECSVNSIVDDVYKVVFVVSDVPWGNDATVPGDHLEPIIDKLQKTFPGKLIIYRGSWNKQLEQVNAGLKFIKEQLPEATHLFYIDSDEVYSEPALKKLLRMIYSPLYFNRAIRIQYNTYFKSIYYRITPRRWPTAMVLAPIRNFVNFIEARNVLSVNAVDRPDILYEHFSYVRRNDQKINRKIQAHLETEPILDNWFQEVWLNWNPKMKNFHPAQPEWWSAVEKINDRELPVEIVKTFQSWEIEN